MTTTLGLGFFKGEFSVHSDSLFRQLYVPNISRAETERILLERLAERPEGGIFILRDASRSPYPIPEDMTHVFSVSYWNSISGRFNHLLICADDTKLNWAIMIDENEFQRYPSLKGILCDIPFIKRTGMLNALVYIQRKEVVKLY